MTLPPSLAPLAGSHVVLAASAGFVATAVPAAIAYRPRRSLVRAGAGPALVVVAAGGLFLTHNAAWSVGWALVVLAIGGWLATRRPALGAGTVGLGSVLLGFGPGAPPGPLWVRASVAVTTPFVAVALMSFERRWGPLSLPLLAGAAGGIYGTTPDTEQSLILLGAVVGVAAAGWWLSSGIGAAAAPALAGVVVWTAGVGGRGRHAAIIGAVGCLGLLVAEPLAAAALSAARCARPAFGRWGGLVGLGAFQAGVVLACHAAGVVRSTRYATAGVVAVLAVTVEVLVVAGLIWTRAEATQNPPNG